MEKRYLKIAAASLFLMGTIACGGNSSKKADEAKEDQSEMTEDHENHEGHEEMKSDDAKAELLPIPENASVSFGSIEQALVIDPETGEEVSSLKLMFEVQGMEVEPAGELNEGKGHHHLIIDGEPIERGVVVPADSVNIHYGKGQTETTIVLSPGEHTLTMQFADGYHQSYGEQMSATQTVTVK